MRFAVSICALAALASGQEARPPAPMGWTGVLDEKEFAALHELTEGKAPELRGKMVKIGDSNAYLSLPETGKPKSAVLVIHEWWGLNDHVKHWADRLAADGYAALAVDLYGGAVATTRDEALANMKAVDDAAALATLQAGLKFLAEDERVKAGKLACIGWCFGGGWSLRLAMAAPGLDAAVVYYGRLVDDPDQLKKIHAPLLGVFGKRDTGIPPEAVDAFEAAMKKAQRPATILRFDADHAFANPSGARYDSVNAAAAWKQVRNFLGEHLRVEPDGLFTDGSRELQYDVPEGWKPGAPREMRLVNLEVGPDTTCYIAVLPGDAGGAEANLDRWCQQMGQDPLGLDGFEALTRIPMFGRKGTTIRVDGQYQGMNGELIDEAILLGAICSLDDETVFVKMIGPAPEVAPQQKKFEAFCRSLR